MCQVEGRPRSIPEQVEHLRLTRPELNPLERLRLIDPLEFARDLVKAQEVELNAYFDDHPTGEPDVPNR